MLMLFSRLPRPRSEPNFSCYLINGSFMKFLFSFLRPRLAVLGGEKHFRGKRNNAEGIKTFIKHHKQKQGKIVTRKCCSESFGRSRYRHVHIVVVQTRDDFFVRFAPRSRHGSFVLICLLIEGCGGRLRQLSQL